MHPVLFRFPEGIPLIGGAAVNSFGFMLFVAFATSTFILEFDLKRKGLDGKVAWDMLFWALIGGLGGSKLYFLLTHMKAVAADPGGEIFSATGFTWYGGMIGATLLMWMALKRSSVGRGQFFDSVALAAPLAIPLGRIGCLLAGDDYGKPTGSFLGIAFPDGHPPTRVDVLEARYGITVDPALVEQYGQVVPVHPTQLYEIVLSLFVFWVIFVNRDHPHRAGWLFVLWVALYGVQRFVLEFVRLKDDRILLDTFTTAQIISVLFIVLAAWGLKRLSGPEAAGASAGGRRG